jgi:hypothetical protein
MRPCDSNIGIDNFTPNQIADVNIDVSVSLAMLNQSTGESDEHCRCFVQPAAERINQVFGDLKAGKVDGRMVLMM